MKRKEEKCMGEFYFNVIRPLICLSLLIGTPVFYCRWQVKKAERFIEAAKKNKNYTTARAVKSSRVPGKRGSINTHAHYASNRVKYEYTVNGKKYKKVYYFDGENYCIPGTAPGTITIYYRPGNPRKVVTGVPDKMDQANIAIGIILGIVLTVLVANLHNLLSLLG